jgi:cell division protein FtsB
MPRRRWLDAEWAPLAEHVALLQGNHLDRDYLDERVRAMLNYGAPNEIVVYYPHAQ